MAPPTSPRRRFRGFGALLIAPALVLPAAGCGVADQPLRWSLDGRTISGGGDLRPTVWATGPVLAITRAREVTGYDAATGGQRWTVPLSGAVCAASPRPEGGRIAVRFGDGPPGCHRVALIGLDAGEKLWERTITPAGGQGSGEIVISEDAVVAAGRHGATAFRLDDGRPLWAAGEPGAECRIDGLSGGSVLLAARTCENAIRSVHRLDPGSGRSRWSHAVPPEYRVEAMASAGRVVLGLGSGGGGVSRFVVLDASGRPVTSFGVPAKDAVQCHEGRTDLDRCNGVVVTDDAVYARTGVGTSPIAAFDSATGRVRWTTRNPVHQQMFPIAMDGGRIVAAQPNMASGRKGGGGGVPARLVSVDAADGKTSVMWDVRPGTDHWLSSRLFHARYAQGRLFLAKMFVTRGDGDGTVFRAYGEPAGS